MQPVPLAGVDPEFELLQSLLTDPVFLAVAGVLLLVLVVVGVIVARRLVRRLRRVAGDNRHLINRARSELSVRTLPEGPGRRAAELRRRLSTAVAETDRVVAGTDHALVSAALHEQHHELGRLSTSLDAHLVALQREPDAERAKAALPEAEQWTDQLCDIAAEIREQVRAGTTALTGQDVQALGESTSDGTAAMRAGIEFLRAQVKNKPPQQ